MGIRTTIRGALETKLKTVSGLTTTVYQSTNPIESLAANDLINATLPVAYITASKADFQPIERSGTSSMIIWILSVYVITKGNTPALAATALDDLVDLIKPAIDNDHTIGLSSVVHFTEIISIDVWTEQSLAPYVGAIVNIKVTYYA